MCFTLLKCCTFHLLWQRGEFAVSDIMTKSFAFLIKVKIFPWAYSGMGKRCECVCRGGCVTFERFLYMLRYIHTYTYIQYIFLCVLNCCNQNQSFHWPCALVSHNVSTPYEAFLKHSVRLRESVCISLFVRITSCLSVCLLSF